MRQCVYCLQSSVSPGVNSQCWSFIEECSNVMSDKILTANLKTEDEILTKHHYPDTRPRFTLRLHLLVPSSYRSPGCHSLSLLLISSHNIVLQCDIKYLQDESADWSRRVCDLYLGIDSRLSPMPGH